MAQGPQLGEPNKKGGREVLQGREDPKKECSEAEQGNGAVSPGVDLGERGTSQGPARLNPWLTWGVTEASGNSVESLRIFQRHEGHGRARYVLEITR